MKTFFFGCFVLMSLAFAEEAKQPNPEAEKTKKFMLDFLGCPESELGREKRLLACKNTLKDKSFKVVELLDNHLLTYISSDEKVKDLSVYTYDLKTLIKQINEGPSIEGTEAYRADGSRFVLMRNTLDSAIVDVYSTAGNLYYHYSLGKSGFEGLQTVNDPVTGKRLADFLFEKGKKVSAIYYNAQGVAEKDAMKQKQLVDEYQKKFGETEVKLVNELTSTPYQFLKFNMYIIDENWNAKLVERAQKSQQNITVVEAKSNLAAIYTSMASFHSEYDTYTTDLVAAGMSFNGKSRYVCGFSSASSEKNPGLKKYDTHRNHSLLPELQSKDFVYIGSVSEKDLPASTATAKTFTASCVANLDDDSKLDIWTVNEKKEIIHISQDQDSTPVKQ